MTKTIFITGGAGAIGSAAGRRFAIAGYKVAIAYLNEAEKEQADKVVPL